jgi:hypothetical protein
LSAPLPADIIAALLAVQAEVGRLDKSEFNAHGKYKFVSIDAYYEKVATVAAAHGLTWIARVTDTHPVGEKAIQFDYRFDLLHSSGAVVTGFFEHPVVHPIQGAQTAGSALSYADKIFQRHAFKVRTGEGDADDTPPDAIDLPSQRDAKSPTNPVRSPLTNEVRSPLTNEVRSPPPGPGGLLDDNQLMQDVKRVASGLRDNKPVLNVPASGSDLGLIEKVFCVFVDVCATKDELIAFWETNIAALDALMRLDPELHDRVKRAFVARKQQIEGGFS